MVCIKNKDLLRYKLNKGEVLRKSSGGKATEGNRTLDPSLTKRLLCHLSYGGEL